MHDLVRAGLQNPTVANSTFLQDYLGPKVMAQLEKSPLGPSQWNAESVALFRNLCVLMATVLPRADHVIRADVGAPNRAPEQFGPLLMYVGVQLPTQGRRSQFLGIGARQRLGQVSFTVFVAGAASDAQRAILAAEEDPEQLADGFVIRNQADLDRFKAQAVPVLLRVGQALVAQRPAHEGGFMPIQCQQAWGQKCRNREASAQYWDFWKELIKPLSPVEIEPLKTRLQENNGFRKQRIISLLEQYLPVATAFSMGLSDAA